jgi:hypothetical protein
MDGITREQAQRMVHHLWGQLVEHMLVCDACEREDVPCKEQRCLAQLKRHWECRVEQLQPFSWEARVLRRLRGW